jgi:fibronectin-binding autotransporter adhesin
MQPVTLGNLKVGDGQIVGVNKNNASFTFSTVTLNGGIASFAPGTVNLGGGAASGAASLTLGTVSEIFPVSGLSMIGTNTLILAGDATYIGQTFVSNGVMLVNGHILHSPVSVNGDGGTQGGTLGGTGVISAAVTIGDFGNLQPGVSNTVGTLTVSDVLSLNGGTGQGTNTMKLNRDASPNADMVRATTLVEGGTLNVINVGSALQQGDTFKLYDVVNRSGAFTTVLLPPVDLPLFWNTNNLNIDGTISIGPPLVQPTTNASITKVSLSGNNLLVHGTNNNVPNTSFHYVVLTSTNIALPLSSWTPVATNPFNGDGTFDYVQPIAPGTAQQFIEVRAVP